MSTRRNSPSDNPGRRIELRYPLNADITIHEPFAAHGIVINASDNGLRIAVDRALPEGAVCVVEVVLHEGATVEMARVAWIQPRADGYLVGLEFERD
jgi:hypothetical protein